jgi:hypothetical protein
MAIDTLKAASNADIRTIAFASAAGCTVVAPAAPFAASGDD